MGSPGLFFLLIQHWILSSPGPVFVSFLTLLVFSISNRISFPLTLSDAVLRDSAVFLRRSFSRDEGCRVTVLSGATLFFLLCPPFAVRVGFFSHPSFSWGPPQNVSCPGSRLLAFAGVFFFRSELLCGPYFFLLAWNFFFLPHQRITLSPLFTPFVTGGVHLRFFPRRKLYFFLGKKGPLFPFRNYSPSISTNIIFSLFLPLLCFLPLSVRAMVFLVT